MTRSCRHCGRTHPIGMSCPLAPVRVKRSTDASSFRSTWAWTQKARQIRVRDKHLCLLCLTNSVITTDDLEVHHIVPIAEDESLALEDDNLITLCRPHHEEAESGKIDRNQLRQLAALGTLPTPRGSGLSLGKTCKTTQPPTCTKNL